MDNILSSDIVKFLDYNLTIINEFTINKFCSLNEPTENSILFIDKRYFSEEVIQRLPNNVLIIAPLEYKNDLVKNIIYCENPMKTFVKIANNFIKELKHDESNIHPTAIINPRAKLHPSVQIGAYSIVDECEVGENSIIKQHVHIYNNVKIGNCVTIYSSCEIGTMDFGPIINEDGSIEMFPHIGNLIIEDNVSIFPFTAIGKGTIGSTIIKTGVKIDHCCQIGHNTYIGDNTIITANSVIAGSTKIGKSCWIGVNSVIKNQLVIADNVTIGIGSVVTKSILSSQTVAGNPAREISRLIAERKFIDNNIIL